jgi:maleate isomerase
MAAEPELTAMMPDGVACCVTRLPLAGSSKDELLGMTVQVEAASQLLEDVRPDLLVFHCTAVSTWDSQMDVTISERIQAATGIRTTTTATALIHALQRLKAQKIVLLTPYIEEINDREIHFLQHHGIEVLVCKGLGLRGPHEMLAVDPRAWFELAMKTRHPDADAYLISCTAIRTFEIIEELEHKLERPVLTSNQAAAWYALRLIGISEPVERAGQLLLRSTN